MFLELNWVIRTREDRDWIATQEERKCASDFGGKIVCGFFLPFSIKSYSLLPKPNNKISPP